MSYQTHVLNLSQFELSQEILKSLKQERSALVRFLVCLAEMDERKLFAAEGYSSLFTYLTLGLNFSPACAQKRSQVCRLTRRFPQVLEAIEGGELNLSGASIIAAKITEANVTEILNAVARKSCDEIAWIATKYERKIPDTPTEISFLGQNMMSAENQENSNLKPTDRPNTFEPNIFSPKVPYPINPPVPMNKIKPQSENSATVSFSCSKDLVDKIARAKELLGTSQLENIFSKAIEALLDKHAPERRNERREKREQKKVKAENHDATPWSHVPCGTERTSVPCGTESTSFPDGIQCTSNPHGKGKTVGSLARKALPIPLRDQVFKNYGYRCAYKNSNGMRCNEKMFLEIDHIKPLGCKGSDEISNLRPLCRAHNQHFAKLVYGKEKMLKYG